MLIAATNDFGYRLFFLLHMFAIIVAFAPGFVWPLVTAQLRRTGNESLGPAMSKVRAANTARVHGPALLAAGIFGFGMIGMSDSAWKFSDNWISIAMVLWFVMLGVVYGLLVPAERKASRGDKAAEQRISMLLGMSHLLLLLMLIDMIWKPGA